MPQHFDVTTALLLCCFLLGAVISYRLGQIRRDREYTLAFAFVIQMHLKLGVKDPLLLADCLYVCIALGVEGKSRRWFRDHMQAPEACAQHRVLMINLLARIAEDNRQSD